MSSGKNEPQRLCMKRGWVYEAASCPTRPNEIKKTKLQIYAATQPCFIHFVV